MPEIARVRVVIDGLGGLPGVATFYGLDGPSMPGPLNSFWQAIRNLLPAGVTVAIPNTGDMIDAATGNLTGTWSGGTIGSQTGGGSGGYAAPAGALAQWRTAEVRDGSRVRGRTFIVPIVVSAYTASGQLAADPYMTISAAAAGLVTALSPNLIVWHRPLSAVDAAKRKTPTSAHAGAACIVTGSGVSSKVVVLRSRRD